MVGLQRFCRIYPLPKRAITPVAFRNALLKRKAALAELESRQHGGLPRRDTGELPEPIMAMAASSGLPNLARPKVKEEVQDYEEDVKPRLSEMDVDGRGREGVDMAMRALPKVEGGDVKMETVVDGGACGVPLTEKAGAAMVGGVVVKQEKTEVTSSDVKMEVISVKEEEDINVKVVMQNDMAMVERVVPPPESGGECVGGDGKVLGRKVGDGGGPEEASCEAGGGARSGPGGGGDDAEAMKEDTNTEEENKDRLVMTGVTYPPLETAVMMDVEMKERGREQAEKVEERVMEECGEGRRRRLDREGEEDGDREGGGLNDGRGNDDDDGGCFRQRGATMEGQEERHCEEEKSRLGGGGGDGEERGAQEEGRSLFDNKGYDDVKDGEGMNAGGSGDVHMREEDETGKKEDEAAKEAEKDSKMNDGSPESGPKGAVNKKKEGAAGTARDPTSRKAARVNRRLELKAKLRLLEEEKHRLVQMLKQVLSMEEEHKKKSLALQFTSHAAVGMGTAAVTTPMPSAASGASQGPLLGSGISSCGTVPPHMPTGGLIPTPGLMSSGLVPAGMLQHLKRGRTMGAENSPHKLEEGEFDHGVLQSSPRRTMFGATAATGSALMTASIVTTTTSQYETVGGHFGAPGNVGSPKQLGAVQGSERNDKGPTGRLGMSMSSQIQVSQAAGTTEDTALKNSPRAM